MLMKTIEITKEAGLLLETDARAYNIRKNCGIVKGRRKYKLIDLFCGAGGMTLGFSRRFGHDFEPVFANDFNEYCIKTYKKNFGPHCVSGDIINLLKSDKDIIPKADVVIGGPPCQGFSLLNKKREGDPRNQLWRPYLEVVKRSGASVFVIENVPQLLGTTEHTEIVEVAGKMGFKVWSGKLCAADYGVPQTRWRAIIVGSRFFDPEMVFPPRKTHYNPSDKKSESAIDLFCSVFIDNPRPWRTVRDAMKSLPPPVGTEIRKVFPPYDLHFGRTPSPMSLKRYKAIPREGMNRFDLQKHAPELTPACWLRKKSGGTDLFGRLWWDRPSFTIRTEFFKPEKGRFLHPQQHRPITHREAARLQSFPDTFIFEGSKIEIAKQIGNAVPPMFAARIADCIFSLLYNGS